MGVTGPPARDQPGERRGTEAPSETPGGPNPAADTSVSPFWPQDRETDKVGLKASGVWGLIVGNGHPVPFAGSQQDARGKFHHRPGT